MASATDTSTLLFHGTIGDPEKPKKCIRFHISTDIPRDLSDKLMIPVEDRPEPAAEELNTIRMAIEDVTDQLGSNVFLLEIGKRCCVCNKAGLADFCFKPFNLDDDIKNAWNWMAAGAKEMMQRHLDLSNKDIKPIPQVWSRVLPICEGSEECQKGAEMLARAWKNIDGNVKRWIIIDSWRAGLENIGKGDLVTFTKGVSRLEAIFHCKVCGTDALRKCGRCHTAIYCSNDCQEKDWPEHHKQCKPSGEMNGSSLASSSSHSSNSNTSPIFDLPAQLNMLSIDAPPSAPPIPKRPIVLDNVTLREKNRTDTPLPIILYHGIIGNPTNPSCSELFRIVMPLPQEISHTLNPSSRIPHAERQAKVLEWFKIFELMFTSRLVWRCINCGEETIKFKHHFRFREELIKPDGLKLLPYVWDLIMPVCEDDECYKSGEKVIDEFEGRHEHKREVVWSWEEGSRKHWNKMEIISRRNAEDIMNSH